MKKDEVKKLKKLQISRETLKTLASSDARQVVGGGVMSCPTRCTLDTIPEDCDTA